MSMKLCKSAVAAGTPLRIFVQGQYRIRYSTASNATVQLRQAFAWCVAAAVRASKHAENAAGCQRKQSRPRSRKPYTGMKEKHH